MSTYQFTADDADIVIRATRCDAPREFRVHKIILSLASPLFKDMFSIPQPASSAASTEAALPVIDVDDTPEDFESFLLMIYPFGLPSTPTLDAISRVLTTLDKYQVQGPSLNPLKSLLVSPEFLKNDPIGVYSLACVWGFKEEADLAAPYTSSRDVPASASAEDIQRMTGTEYHRIIILGKERQLKCQHYIRTTPVACVGCANYKKFYATFRHRLLEDFIADSSTFYDQGRCIIRCFELAMETEWNEGAAGCGVGRDSHLGKFISSLAAKLSSHS